MRILLLLSVIYFCISNSCAVDEDLPDKDGYWLMSGMVKFGSDDSDSEFEEETCLTYHPRSIKEVLSTVQGTITSGIPAEKIVISFDLDETLWRRFNFYQEIKVPPDLNLPLKNLIDTICAENLLYEAATYHYLIEEDAPKTLQEIANLGVKLMATTSRLSTADSIDQTTKTFEHLGINFNQMMANATKKSPIQFHAIDLPAIDYHEFCAEALGTKPKFTEIAVLFTSGHAKGETVREFLKMQSYQEQNITHLSHTDDRGEWCESIHHTLPAIGVETTCFQFSPSYYDFSTQAEIDRYLAFIRSTSSITPS